MLFFSPQRNAGPELKAKKVVESITHAESPRDILTLGAQFSELASQTLQIAARRCERRLRKKNIFGRLQLVAPAVLQSSLELVRRLSEGRTTGSMQETNQIVDALNTAIIRQAKKARQVFLLLKAFENSAYFQFNRTVEKYAKRRLGVETSSSLMREAEHACQKLTRVLELQSQDILRPRLFQKIEEQFACELKCKGQSWYDDPLDPFSSFLPQERARFEIAERDLLLMMSLVSVHFIRGDATQAEYFLRKSYALLDNPSNSLVESLLQDLHGKRVAMLVEELRTFHPDARGRLHMERAQVALEHMGRPDVSLREIAQALQIFERCNGVDRERAADLPLLLCQQQAWSFLTIADSAVGAPRSEAVISAQFIWRKAARLLATRDCEYGQAHFVREQEKILAEMLRLGLRANHF
jgi:hypothetical protein